MERADEGGRSSSAKDAVDTGKRAEAALGSGPAAQSGARGRRGGVANGGEKVRGGEKGWGRQVWGRARLAAAAAVGEVAVECWRRQRRGKRRVRQKQFC